MRGSNILSALTRGVLQRALSGELALEGGKTLLECDLVFDQAWRGTMDARYFIARGDLAPINPAKA